MWENKSQKYDLSTPVLSLPVISFWPILGTLGRISYSVMRRMIKGQHAAQYGFAY
jgi:hypothetical protein